MEVFAGRYVAQPPVTEFPNVRHLNELMIVGPVTVRSACSHHLCPIIGRVWVGVMPNEHSALIGLSKYARLVEWVMTRPQIQEEAVTQLADLLQDKMQPDGLAIVMAGGSLLHAVARRQGHGLQDDQQHHARLLPQGPRPAPGVSLAADGSEGIGRHNMLVRLLYASRAIGEIDDALVASILERSRSYNMEHGITGILCTYTEGSVFLQVLEGGRAAVNKLYASIVCDPRHREVTLLDYAEVPERRFASWRMGSVNLNRVNQGSILRFSESPVLDPFSMSAQAVLALLEELTSTGAIVSRDDS